MQPEFTLTGGILRFVSMGRLMRERLGEAVNIPGPDDVQFVGALGAAVLGQRRLKARAEHRLPPRVQSDVRADS
jgi:activator of 2-hydroxyglutaryl-CoA dehydratase